MVHIGDSLVVQASLYTQISFSSILPFHISELDRLLFLDDMHKSVYICSPLLA